MFWLEVQVQSLLLRSTSLGSWTLSLPGVRAFSQALGQSGVPRKQTSFCKSWREIHIYIYYNYFPPFPISTFVFCYFETMYEQGTNVLCFILLGTWKYLKFLVLCQNLMWARPQEILPQAFAYISFTTCISSTKGELFRGTVTILFLFKLWQYLAWSGAL